MDTADDGAWVAAALIDRLAALTFADRSTEEVIALIADAIAGWAAEQGWRVYRRAASVLPLPPPYSRQHSFLDLACARPAGPPVVVEIDHTDRRRTVEKLLAEAAAGRVAIWVRWGARGFAAPAEPVQMVTLTVTSRRGPAPRGRLHSRLPASDLPAPVHSAADITGRRQDALFADDRPATGLSSEPDATSH